MSPEVATIITGIMILIGAVLAGGAIYSGLEKIADAIKEQK